MKIIKESQDILIIYHSDEVDVTTIKREGGRWVGSYVNPEAKDKSKQPMKVSLAELSAGLSQSIKDAKAANARVKTIKSLLRVALEAEVTNDFNDSDDLDEDRFKKNEKETETKGDKSPPF